MGKFYSFILGLAIGVGFYHLLMHNQCVYATDGWHYVSKTSPRLSPPYIDIRAFAPETWVNYPELALELQQAGLGHLITNSVEAAVQDAAREGINNLLGQPDEAAAAGQ